MIYNSCSSWRERNIFKYLVTFINNFLVNLISYMQNMEWESVLQLKEMFTVLESSS